MNESEFVDRRRKDWDRLLELCALGENSPKALGGTLLVEFVRLYRLAAADLSRARTESSNLVLISQLNQLVGRAYAVLYRNPRKGVAETLRGALLAGAQAVRQARVFIFLSVGLLLASFALHWAVLDTRPDVRTSVIAPMEEDLFGRWKEGSFDVRTDGENAGMWAFYATNNPLVTIVWVSQGIATAGVGSVGGLWQLGRQLGALSFEMNSVGKLGFFYASIAPHGASELTGAMLAAAAGLNLGWAILNPGRRSRTLALKQAGRVSMILLVKAFIMMLIAAPFEAFFSFNPAFESWFKALVGVLIFSAWMLYWTSYGRDLDAAKG